MSVKTIFKALIGTIVVIVMISVCMELFNVNVTGVQIKTVAAMATKQAAELFTQETYKNTGTSMAVNMADIKAADGTTYISGNFYGDNTTVHSIWNKLYGEQNTTLRDVCMLTEGGTPKYASINISGYNKKITYKWEKAYGIEYKNAYVKSNDSIVFNQSSYGTGNRYVHQAYPWNNYADEKRLVTVYKDLGQLYAGVYSYSDVITAVQHPISFEQYQSGAPIVYQKNYASNALKMKNKYFTPVNIGFPYFDPEVINKMFQWDLAMILSNGTSDSIMQDEAGKYYINYKGFRCYVQDAYIDKFEYYIINAGDKNSFPGGSVSARNEAREALTSLTGLDASKLTKADITADGNGTLDNQYITVVKIKYNIPIAYQGISPLKKIFEFVWDTEVDGLKDNEAVAGVEIDRSGMTGSGEFSLATGEMKNDGDGALTTFGEVTYVLVR